MTSATKSNASRFGYVLWDEVAEEVAAGFPDVRYERVLVDALAARMVRDPGSLDVVVASNLFGDILTDLAAAIQGGMGMAASANVAPGSGAVGAVRARPRLGARHRRAAASRTRRARSGAPSLMLEHLGEQAAAADADAALEDVCRDGRRARATSAASATTREVGDAVAAPRRGAQRTAPMSAPPATTRPPAATRRLPITSPCRPSTSAENSTAQSDWVALSGATIETRPWSNASSRLS